MTSLIRCVGVTDQSQVAVIGAGISGTAAGALLPAKVPGIDLTIYEKNSDIVSSFGALRAIILTRSREEHG